MSSNLDNKQKKLVKNWYGKAQSSYEEDDYFSAFISLWIAFNAYCYGKYSNKAVRPVADLNNASKVVAGEIKGSVSVDANNSKTKITIQSIHSPATFSISIKKGYDEKRIYYEFAKKFESDHISLLENQISYQEAIQELKKSLQKGDRYYVIRMQRLSDYNQQQSVDELGRKGILVTLEDDKFKTIIDVLYQVRCNLFHGGKDPEVRNNDQIICAAYPVLEKIMNVIVRSLELNMRKRKEISTMTIRESTIAKLQQLPESALHEVNNFIDYLLLKHQREVAQESPEEIAAAWAKWFEAVEQLEIASTESVSGYQALLLNKYRQQGLDL